MHHHITINNLNIHNKNMIDILLLLLIIKNTITHFRFCRLGWFVGEAPA